MDTPVLNGEAPPDDGNDGIKLKLPPIRDELIARQVNTLLAINNSSISMLATLHNVEFESSSEYFQTEGGALEAIEKTVVDTQARLQALLKDESCWNLAERQTLEQHSIEVFELKKQSLRMGMAPHVRFKPQFAWMPGIQKWVVWIGNIQVEDERVLGTGDTIAEAIANYDKEFDVRKADQRIAKPPFGQEQRTQNEQQNKMDGANDQNAAGNAGVEDTTDGDGRKTRRNPRRSQRETLDGGQEGQED
jgi:hypothetical protein